MYCPRVKRTTLFTTTFTVVCPFKSMCVPSFVVIGYCVRELLGRICRYCQRLVLVVLQELHCLPNCLHVCMIRV